MKPGSLEKDCSSWSISTPMIWILGNNRDLVKIEFGNNCMMGHKNLVMKKLRIQVAVSSRGN
jgi:hypothetical protein